MQIEFGGFPIEPWVLAVLACTWLVWALVRLRLALASMLWPSVEGIVLRARIESRQRPGGEDSGDERYYVQVVRYRYTVEGRTHEAERLSFRDTTANTYEAAAAELAGVVTGAPCRVHHHPRAHRLAVLKPGAGPTNYIEIGLTLAAVVFALILVMRNAG